MIRETTVIDVFPPSWGTAPEWAKYLLFENGLWFWCETEPFEHYSKGYQCKGKMEVAICYEVHWDIPGGEVQKRP